MSKINKIKTTLLNEYPDLTGSLAINENIEGVVTVTGQVSTADETFKSRLEELMHSEFENLLVGYDLKINNGFSILSSNGSETSQVSETHLDEVNVIYFGMMKVKNIKENPEYKIINQNMKNTMTNVFHVLNFLTPIILDKNLKVIDGNFRLELARENNVKEVMVVVIDAADTRSEFLRLALNRSSEFQRWTYNEVDDYVDNTPQAQPLLEPLGFFGKKVLPVSFFANTVVNYEIDPYNEQQKLYRQETGIAKWAEIQRERNLELIAKKKAKKTKKPVGVSLFDLIPSEEDFLETHDIDSAIEEHQEEMREVANTITVNYDAKRKAEIEAKGGIWQNTRRTSSEKAADLRAEAEAMNDEIEETE